MKIIIATSLQSTSAASSSVAAAQKKMIAALKESGYAVGTPTEDTDLVEFTVDKKLTIEITSEGKSLTYGVYEIGIDDDPLYYESSMKDALKSAISYLRLVNRTEEKEFIAALGKEFTIKTNTNMAGGMFARTGKGFDLDKLKKVMKTTGFVSQGRGLFPDPENKSDYHIIKGEVTGVFSVDTEDKTFYFEFSGY